MAKTSPGGLPGRPLAGLRGPFKGFSRLRVLDFTKLLPGPYAGEALAELGCRVTKIEAPHFPDGARAMPPKIGGVGAAFWLLNRRKKLVSLDFRTPAGLRKVRALVERSDVLLEGFRPGLMERVGLGPKALLRLNPKLVYCSLIGYPASGPWRRKAGHDLNFLAVSGFFGLQGGAAAVLPTQFADLSGSLGAVAGVLAALLERQSTGRGRHVQVAMSEAVHSLLPIPLAEMKATGRDPGGAPRWWSGAHPFYRLYETAGGGRLAVAALERHFALSLLDALGLGALKPLADDPLANARPLAAALGRALRAATAREWARRLKDKDLCVTPVLSLEQAAAFQEWLRAP